MIRWWAGWVPAGIIWPAVSCLACGWNAHPGATIAYGHPRLGPFYCPRCRQSLPTWNNASTSSRSALCPDLLRYEQIGEADTWRGRIVRLFFWLMRARPI